DLEGELGIERRGAEAIEDAGVRIKDTLMGGPNAIIYLIERKDRPKSEVALYREFLAGGRY
ncbi:MAG: hypothetical protein V1900_03330, partial [Candidatus Aenigmatarchaeota archaeon]